MNSQKQNLLSKFLEGKLVLRGIYLVGSPKTVFSAFTATTKRLAQKRWPTLMRIRVHATYGLHSRNDNSTGKTKTM